MHAVDAVLDIKDMQFPPLRDGRRSRDEFIGPAPPIDQTHVNGTVGQLGLGCSRHPGMADFNIAYPVSLGESGAGGQSQHGGDRNGFHVSCSFQ
jgi:hypothetical protein